MTSVASPAETSEPGAVRSALRGTGAAIREVFVHPSLRRIQLALAGSMIGDWAYATATTVWVFGVGGAKAVGLWVAIRLALLALFSPLASTLADKLPRKPILIASDVARCGLVVGAGLCIAGHSPVALVYVLATLSSLVSCVFRPAQRAWLPSLVDSPEQLAASNGVSSTIESLAIFVGPAIGASLVAATDVQTVFYINAATFLLSAALIVGITARPAEPKAAPDETKADPAHEPAEGALTAILAGFREIGRQRDLKLVALLSSAQTLVTGAASVFSVILVVKYLNTGPRGVGYYDAVMGVGAVVGGFVAIGRSARQRVMVDLTGGVVLWSVPLLLIVAWPSAAALFACAAILGFANPSVDVNFATAIQCMAPDRVLGRVFGAMETMLIASMAAGAAVLPFLVDSLGIRPTLTIISLVVAVPSILLLPAARGADRRLNRPAHLADLQRLPIFASLGIAQLELLAGHLVSSQAEAGSVIVREGEIGDRFYLIESGRVAVTHGAELVREQDAGEYFGEIALLRDVPRTATVTAVEKTSLLTLEREPFLEAVTGNGEAAAALEDVISYRMRF